MKKDKNSPRVKKHQLCKKLSQNQKSLDGLNQLLEDAKKIRKNLKLRFYYGECDDIIKMISETQKSLNHYVATTKIEIAEQNRIIKKRK